MVSQNIYHPFRYAASRPFAKRVASFWQSEVGLRMFPPAQEFERLQMMVMFGYNDALDRMPFDQRPSNMDLAFQEINRAVTYAAFNAHGRNIFHFDAHLLDMFSRTDVGGIPPEAVHLPLDVFYLHFGPQPNLELVPGKPVDGAYIYVQERAGAKHLHFDLTTADAEGHTSPSNECFITNPDVRYHLAIDLSQGADLENLVADAINSEINALRSPGIDTSSLEGLQEEVRNQGVDLRDQRQSGAERRAEQLSERFPTFRAAMNLAINAIFYLSAYPDDFDEGWPANAPKNLTEKADKAQTAKEKRRAESKLLPMGFTRVKFVRSPGAPSRMEGEGSARAHWRRGHWRNQPYGEGRKLRKPVWIKPVIVNSDAFGEEMPGRIYDVQPKEEL